MNLRGRYGDAHTTVSGQDQMGRNSLDARQDPRATSSAPEDVKKRARVCAKQKPALVYGGVQTGALG